MEHLLLPMRGGADALLLTERLADVSPLLHLLQTGRGIGVLFLLIGRELVLQLLDAC